MNKTTLFLALLIFNISNSQESWYPLGPDDFNQPSYGQINHSKITHDNNNIPYVVYSDVREDNKIRAMKYIDNEWVYASHFIDLEENISSVSIKFNNSNQLYLAYKDNNIKVKKLSGLDWVNVGVTNTQTDFDFSFEIDGNNVPYIAYSNSLNSNKAAVKKFNGTNWILVGTSSISVNQANHVSLAIDNSNIPFIVYEDVSVVNKVSVQKFENNAWSYVGQQGLSQGQSAQTHIKFDNNNLPVIIYADGSVNNKATMQKYENGSWQSVGQSGFTSNEFSNLSFQFDLSNNPYVTYLNTDNNNIEVYRYYQSNWNIIPSPSLNRTDFPSITITNDNLLIAYKDVANGDFLVVKKLNNNNWEQLGDEPISIFKASRYATDNQGVIYMFYIDKNDGKAYIKIYDQEGWSYFLPEPISTGIVSALDIEIDNNNQICIVYNDRNGFLYKRFNGSIFETIATYPGASNPISSIRIKHDINNIPSFAVLYDSHSTSPLIVRKFENNSWSSTIVSFSFDTEERDFDIAFDKDVTPNILYIAYRSYSRMKVVKRVNETIIEEVGERLDLGAYSPSLVIINNQVHVAYHISHQIYDDGIYVKKFNGSFWEEMGNSGLIHNTYNPILKVNNEHLYLFHRDIDGYANLRKFNNSSWDFVGYDNFSAGSAGNIGLIFSNTIPVVLYSSSARGFAKYYGTEGPLSITDFSKGLVNEPFIYPNPALDNFKLKTDDEILSVKIYDILGKEILEVKDYDEINISGLESGTYLVVVKFSNSTKTLRLMKK